MTDHIDTAKERVAAILNDWEYQARERDARDPMREQILEEAAIIRHALDAERARAEKAEAERDQALARLVGSYESAVAICESDSASTSDDAEGRMIAAWFDDAAQDIRALTPDDAEAALQRVVDAAWNEAVGAAVRIAEGWGNCARDDDMAREILALKRLEASHDQ